MTLSIILLMKAIFMMTENVIVSSELDYSSSNTIPLNVSHASPDRHNITSSKSTSMIQSSINNMEEDYDSSKISDILDSPDDLIYAFLNKDFFHFGKDGQIR